jgi:hypothetical protein
VVISSPTVEVTKAPRPSDAMVGRRSVCTWWSVMMMFSTPSPANCATRGPSATRESAERMPCTWKSDDTKPAVSSTRAICGVTLVVVFAVMVTGAE